MDEATPVKLCECGCGQPTSIAKQRDPIRGYVPGSPKQFRRGHQNRGKKFSAEVRARMSGSNSGQWRGDEVGYSGIHRWLQKHYPKTGTCDECKKRTRTEFALIHGHAYSRNREDYLELCRQCHARYDQTGREHSPETRTKLSEARKRHWERRRQLGTDSTPHRGERHLQAKLTEQAVIEIRRARTRGESMEAVGARYGVARMTAYNAAVGNTWAHVKEGLPTTM